MTRVTCAEGEHTLPLSVQLSLTDGCDRAATILALSHCPACPDVHLQPSGLAGMEVCPCCWTVWWTDAERVRCTPGHVESIEEPGTTPARRSNVSLVLPGSAA